jgi:AsmA protein
MAKALRTTAIGGALLAGALVLVALLAPRFVNEMELRRSVAAELSSLTGHAVSVAGRARLFMLPWPTVTLDSVEIGGEDGEAPVLRTEGLTARLGFVQLLRGRYDVRGLALDRPRVSLVVHADGRSNWRSGASILSLLVPEDAGDRPARLGELAISGGQISYRDDQARRRTELADFDMNLAWPYLGSRATASGRFRLRGEEIRFQGGLERPSALFRQEISPFELSFETEAVRAQLSGNAFAAGDIRLEGRLSFTSPSIRRLAGWLVPEATNVPDAGPVQGNARVKVAERSLTLEEARLVVNGARGEGVLAFVFDRTRTQVQGTMDFDRVDARQLVRTQMPRLGEDGDWASEQLRGDRIGPVDLDLRLSAGTLLIGANTIRTAAISLLSRDGRVEASIADGQIYGGRVAGRIVAEARPGAAGVRLRGMLSLAGARIDDPLREFFGVIRVSGTGTVSLDVTGEGETVREVAGSLRGEASMRLTQGALTGIDLGALMRRAERSPVDALIEARGGRSPIDLAQGTVRIADGQATTDEISIRGPGYRVTLRGGTTAAPQALNLVGVLASAPEPNRPVVELPFVIRGPLFDPVVVPNPEALMRRATPPAEPPPTR